MIMDATKTGIEPQEGDNLLITNFDRNYTLGDEFISVVHIQERYGYTPVNCGYRKMLALGTECVPTEYGYRKTVIVQGDRERLREAVREALDYARQHNLRVQVNNKMVRDDIRSGVFDVDGLVVIYGGAAL